MPRSPTLRSRVPFFARLKELRNAFSRTSRARFKARDSNDPDMLDIETHSLGVNLNMNRLSQLSQYSNPSSMLTLTDHDYGVPLDIPAVYLAQSEATPHVPVSTHELPQRKPRITISDLPFELLARIFYIFMFSVSKPHLMDPELEDVIATVFSHNPTSAPLLFCQVCSYWRNVAVRTSELWSAMHIWESMDIRILETWLKRSESHPLSMYVSMNGSPTLCFLADDDDGKALPRHTVIRNQRIMQLLYDNISRWTHVAFHMRTSKDLRDLVFAIMPSGSRGKSPAKLLQYLHLSACLNDPADYDIELRSRLSGLAHPALRHFSSSAIGLFPDTLRPGANSNSVNASTTQGAVLHSRLNSNATPLWTHLLQLTFEGETTPAVLRSFFEACPNLRFLYIGTMKINIRHRSSPNSPTPPTIAHNLLVLIIDRITGDISAPFEDFVAPRLKGLFLSDYGHPSEWFHPNPNACATLVRFIELSGCDLESLCIKGFGIRITTLREEFVRELVGVSVIRRVPNVSLEVREDLCNAETFCEAFMTEMVPGGRGALEVDAAYAVRKVKRRGDVPVFHVGWGNLHSERPGARKGPTATWSLVIDGL
ncbi:hypothetical protein CVT24_004364 [Panaeolus cyanescens]|uniref:F-box domain-containing protein n=1 Tax=Panaeolus cyanescens TaxID=181874 RepID=A0A409YBH3_9AGAR|nr:hypothetical protein CVT24_004364 [Panaeolus cyanescens]